MSDAPADKTAPDAFDVAVLGEPTDDGGGRKVLRLRPDGVAIGELRPLQEGKPIQGEVVQLKPREGNPRVCDVDVAVPAPAAAASPAAPARGPSPPAARRSGPAQVATPAYRDSWERIFGEAPAGGGAAGRKGDLN